MNFNGFTFGKRTMIRKFAVLKSGAGTVPTGIRKEIVYILSASALYGDLRISVPATSIVHKIEFAESRVKAKLTILKNCIFLKMRRKHHGNGNNCKEGKRKVC